MNHELEQVIKNADRAINNGDHLIEFYSEDATLVVKPGTVARGKEEIRRAFIAIAEYFNYSLIVNQEKMAIIETGDTALVVAQAQLSANQKDDSEFSMERTATYVFKKDSTGTSRCIIDNSHGAEII
ncbi:YybH family protein [Peribacillus frigoritolerans]|uniref:YybH family protein n=1 Tax=Peribacillus frigoritolerans TaxID=450367 RepID=UPI00209ED339|nr:nuclear transport factor 2 family protein [Peribacillus frigoritolerans]